MRTEVILLALLVILGLTNKPMGRSPPRLYDFRGCAIKPLDIAFIIDSSWNIALPDFKKGIEIVDSVAGLFRIGPQNVRIAAVTFGSTVNTDTAFGFDKYNVKEEVRNAIQNIPYNPGPGRSTNTAMAIEYARTRFFVNPRPFSKQIAVVFTSSTSNDFQKTKAEASLLKKQGVEIFAVGVGNGISVKELKAIVSSPDLFFTLRSYYAIMDIYVKLTMTLCKWCDSRPIDLNFVIDPVQMGKGGIKRTNRFIKAVLNYKNFEDGQIRAGIISAEAPRAVPINRYTKPKDILAYFDIHKTTDMASLIAKLRTDAFHPSNGGRVNARKFAVLFLKGKLRNPQKTISELDLANKQGIYIFVIDMDGMNIDISRTARRYSHWVDAHFSRRSTKENAQYITRYICSIFERIPDSFVDIY